MQRALIALTVSAFAITGSTACATKKFVREQAAIVGTRVDTVASRVDATDTEGWWYEGCGIYRHVWLRQTERVHIAHWGTYVTTPAVTAAAATVRTRSTPLARWSSGARRA